MTNAFPKFDLSPIHAAAPPIALMVKPRRRPAALPGLINSSEPAPQLECSPGRTNFQG